MKKRIIVGLLSIVLASCAFQDIDSSNIATQSAPISTIQFVPTYPVVAPQIVVDFSSQHPLIINEKRAALDSYDKQVIDNGLSLYAEEVNLHCHKVEKHSGVRTPMTIMLTFRNLNSHPVTISNRFASHPWAPSMFTGADFTSVFFFENGDRIYTSGDNLSFDYDPGPESFVDIPGNGVYTVSLDFNFPYQIGRGDGPTWYFSPGFYFVKFIYWTAQVERDFDSDGTRLYIARAISSNPIVICIE